MQLKQTGKKVKVSCDERCHHTVVWELSEEKENFRRWAKWVSLGHCQVWGISLAITSKSRCQVVCHVDTLVVELKEVELWVSNVVVRRTDPVMNWLASYYQTPPHQDTSPSCDKNWKHNKSKQGENMCLGKRKKFVGPLNGRGFVLGSRKSIASIDKRQCLLS